MSDNFYQVDGKYVRLHLRKAQTKGTASGNALFVIDKSGSMSNDYLQVKNAVKYMTEATIDPNFILYESYARLATASEVLSSHAGGGTNFEAAFKCIQTFIQGLPKDDHVNIVFMTDGQNNGGNLQTGLQVLKAYLASCRRTSCIHTIGFSRGHDRNLLEKIKALGTTEGVYRYAGNEHLDEKFEELFDFICVSSKATISIGKNFSKTTDCTKVGNEIELDLLVNLCDVDSSGELFTGKPCTITVDSEEIELVAMPADSFSQLRIIEELEIVTQEDLTKAQKLLIGINPAKATKEKRRELLELKLVVQQKLDKFHSLFAEIARGLVSGDNVSAQLNSLRHETKFTKARRARAMDQRIASNIDEILAIEDELEKLPPPNLDNFTNLDFTCSLSNSTILEIMRDSNSDFLVFPLRIARPEVAIDAPTQIVIENFLVGRYSFESFKDSLRYAINNVGSQKALGGFTEISHKNDEAVGLFRGPDGELTNACLPLYINEDHWKRVEIQLKPILGYFFTMDPLGYKGDQMIALYMILGHLVSLQSAGTFCSEFGNWILEDFTKTCTAVLPLVMKYLGDGRYSGRVRGDLVEEFVASPVNRTKEALSSLLVIIGWNQCTNYRDKDTKRFDFAFVEEVWRRAFTAHFKGQPRNQVDEWLESLLFLETDKIDAGGEGEALLGNQIKTENKVFGEWARAKLDLLGKKKCETLLKQYPNGPTSASGSEGLTYTPRSLVVYEEHAEELDAIVDNILTTIAGKNQFLEKLFGGIVLGKGFSGKEKWLMLIQSLKYSNNSAMNQAVASGDFKNTYEYFYPENSATPEAMTVENFLNSLYTQYEVNRKNDWNAILTKKADFANAKKIAMCPDLYSFAGRVLSKCPTRGGGVFTNLVSVLASGNVDGKAIPNLYEKVRTIMTGKVEFVEGTPISVIGGGLSWAHCSMNTAKQLRDVVTPEQWGAIESSMYGVSGWVYRDSDIPNRHGHCNSNPNPLLTTSFRGFNLGNVAAFH